MRLELAFWSPWDASEDDARADVERQAREWAVAERKVTACRIVTVDRPDASRPTWWVVTVDVDLEAHPVEQPTLWGAA